MKNQNQYQILMNGKDGETYIYTRRTPEDPFTLASSTNDGESVIFESYGSALEKVESLRWSIPGIELEVATITIDPCIDDFIQEIERLSIGQSWQKSDTKVKRVSESEFEIFNGGHYQATEDLQGVVDTLMIDFA